MSQFPILRVEIEGSRHAILTALSGSHKEIEEAARKAIEGINIEEIVRAQVYSVVPVLLQKAVEQAVRDIISGIDFQWDELEVVRERVRKELLEHLKGG